MNGKKYREYRCDVVHETVRIRLLKKPIGGLQSNYRYFVQCDQEQCQNVEENAPPCPLNLSMFGDEIREREEKRRLHRESSEIR